MKWWRRNWRWLIASIVTLLAGTAILVLFILRRTRKAAELKLELDLLKAKAKVDGLEADKKARSTELEKDVATKMAVDMEIADAKREAIETVLNVSKMTDEDVVNTYREMGY